MTDGAFENTSSALWQRAEDIVRNSSQAKLESLSSEEIQDLVHDLQVRQAELELRNEELHRLQAELQLSRDRYADLYRFAPIGCLTLDENEAILEVNLAGSDLLGVESSHLIGQAFSQYVASEDRASYMLFRRQLSETGKATSDQIKLARRDGTQLYARLEGVTPPSGDSSTCCRIVVSDITQYIHMEQILQQRTAQLEALREVSLEITAQLDLDTLLRSVVSRAVELLEARGGGLYLYQPDQDVLEWATALDPEFVPTNTTFRRGEGMAGKVWETGQPLIVDDYQAWEHRAIAYDGLPNAAALGVPIRWGAEFLGTLSVWNVPPRPFSPVSIELLSMFATQAAIAIRNSQQYEASRELHRQTQRDAEAKAVLLREVNHRVQNNLSTILYLLELHGSHGQVDSQAAHRAVIDDLSQRIKAMSTAHRLLSGAEWSSLLLGELARQIIDSALQAFPYAERVSLDVSRSPVRVVPVQANNLAMVICELVTNSAKYAWPELQAGHISVRIDHHNSGASAGIVTLEYRDDGPGYPEEVLNLGRGGLGWDLIRSLVVHGLGGEVALRNEQGAVTTIHFPAL
jgi:PAS domain S-box-containing protein